MFVSEFVSDENAKELWIVSPWISNIPLIDNRSGDFDSLNPEWARREIRLAEVLLALVVRGSNLIVVTRDVDTNVPFISALREMANQTDVSHQIQIVFRSDLHTKGIVLSRSQLLGSMNLTHNGLEILEEWIEFCIDLQDVALLRTEFRHLYGEGFE